MRRKTKNLIGITLLCITFAAFCLVGYKVTKGKYVGPYLQLDNELRSLLDEDMYIDFGLGVNSLSHDIFYHGWGASIQYAREADILILGNSRTLCGFSLERMREFERKNDVRFYNMSFGFNESVGFPKYVMDKYQLKPKIVIVNANQFFVNKPSKYGGKLLNRSSWDQFRNRLDDYMKYLHFKVLRKYTMHFLPDFRVVGDYAYVRSERDGFWTIWNLNRPSVALKDNPVAKKEDYNLELARQFNNYVKSRGGVMVLTYVPNPKSNVTPIRRLARELDVDLIYPEIDGLKSFDGSHLDSGSSGKFTGAFLREFEGLLDHARIND